MLSSVPPSLALSSGHASAPNFGAVVLAAGRSSRMGALKPLLPVGRVAALERVVNVLRTAGVQHIVVVVGHEARALTSLLDRLGVDVAHNPDYESGMFSSVQVGVRALPVGLDAFFVLPVDHPLVRATVIQTLQRRWTEETVTRATGETTRSAEPSPARGRNHARSPRLILHPACCGRRGHPPLLAAAYRAAILQAPRQATLRDILASQETSGRQVAVEVEDLTVLLDMDTPADHRVVHRLAGILDAEPGSARTGDAVCESPAEATLCPPYLTDEECLFILSTLKAPENVVRHCWAVAAVGEALAAELAPRQPHLHPALVRSACLLHDMVRTQPGHAALAERLLANLGLSRLGALVGQHMIMDPDRSLLPGITEVELVYLADKLVAEEQVVGLDGREARALEKTRSWEEETPAVVERIGERMNEARRIAAKVESVLGYPLDKLIAGITITPVPLR